VNRSAPTRSIVEIATRLFPFNYSVTGGGNDAAAELLAKYLPFEVFAYESGRELNGWVIPPECVVERALIRRDGRVVLDNTARPLGVLAQSDSFVGRLSLEQLKPHLHTVASDPAAVPYHWSRLYRPREAMWGFCVSQREVDALTPGDYDVELVTRQRPATMKVLWYRLPGASRDTILFDAHNCHPYQANDDVSGIAVGIEIMRRLGQMPRRRLSYALMVAPELFGPMFWLDGLAPDELAALKGSVMLKSVGNDAPLRLQQSFGGDDALDRAAHNVFRTRYGRYDSGEFRAIYGNDETVFEAPPFSIPSISLTRWPFPEYHTDQDTPQRLHESRLEDTVEAGVEICRALEMNVRLENAARGLVCLSSHGLYKSVPSVGAGGVDYNSEAGRWNRLMNLLPRLLDGRTGLLEIAERFQLPVQAVHEYVMQWQAAGLARAIDEGRDGDA
jgi:aminopeptidase-like protein